MNLNNKTTMATYKKRGGKPSTKTEKETSIEDGSTTAEVFNTLDESASRTEEWVIKNQKAILGVIAAVAIATLGYILYDKFIATPSQEEAFKEMSDNGNDRLLFSDVFDDENLEEWEDTQS